MGKFERANAIEKQMKRYIKMLLVLDKPTIIELSMKGFKIDIHDESDFKALVTIYRK